MIDLIKEYKIQFVIVLIVIVGLIFGLIVFVNSFNTSNESGVYVNDELEDEEENPEMEKRISMLEIGESLYEDATNIYSMNPYCGINYEDIDDSLIEEINGIEYYPTPYTSINEINDKILEVLETNPITINNTVKKDGYIYCRYNSPKKSSTHLNTYLSVTSSDETHINYIATSEYIKPTHNEECSINKPMECMNEDIQNEKNFFIIEKIDDTWKVKEFHLYH